MAKLKEIITYCDKLLEPERFSDYCPNGLQVAGREEIKTIVSGTTACQALLDAAVERGADAVLVHHGYFWKDEDPRIVGIKHHRIKTLLTNDVSLIAYHLPLDAHVTYGNNAQLAQLLGFQDPKPIQDDIVFAGHLTASTSADDLAGLIEQRLGRKPLHIASTDKPIHSIVWCSGGAQDWIHAAVRHGADAYLTGEASEHTVHIARENGLHFFAAGHHATERGGVTALGDHVAEKFGIKHHFIDIDNPV